MSILAKAKCPTITFVNPNAISAGSMIAISTDTIYMAPAAVIGAATAVTSMGGDLNGAMEGKVSSVQIATARNMAILKGHNPEIAEAFISPEKELNFGPIKDGPNKPLTLNADQAVQIVDGKPILAKGIASSVEEIIAAEGLQGEIHRPKPFGMERFAMWVERFSALFIVLGIAGAYLELKAPGFGLPGLISVIAFTIFFFGNYVAGNLAGWEAAVVFGLGLVLVIVEIFVLPGTMVVGLLGGLLMLGSLAFAMVDRVDFDLVRRGAESAPAWSELLLRPALNLAGGLFLAGLVVMVAATYLPQTKLMRWMILDSKVGGGRTATAGGSSDLDTVLEQGGTAPSPESSLVGQVGETLTALRPSGKATIKGEVVDVTSNTDFVEPGAKVTVVSQEGSRVVVEAVV